MIIIYTWYTKIGGMLFCVAFPDNDEAPGRCWSPQEAAARSLALNPITFFHGGYYA